MGKLWLGLASTMDAAAFVAAASIAPTPIPQAAGVDTGGGTQAGRGQRPAHRAGAMPASRTEDEGIAAQDQGNAGRVTPVG